MDLVKGSAMDSGGGPRRSMGGPGRRDPARNGRPVGGRPDLEEVVEELGACGPDEAEGGRHDSGGVEALSMAAERE